MAKQNPRKVTSDKKVMAQYIVGNVIGSLEERGIVEPSNVQYYAEEYFKLANRQAQGGDWASSLGDRNGRGRV